MTALERMDAPFLLVTGGNGGLDPLWLPEATALFQDGNRSNAVWASS